VRAPRTAGPDRRPILVFLRDTARDLGTAYKTQGFWDAGAFDAHDWSAGEYACDCSRGLIFYGSGEFACGGSRFVLERILEWDTGETLYSPDAEG